MELNKDILISALKQLPVYKPEDKVWTELTAMLEQGDSDRVLREAIAKLPNYHPAEHVWPKVNEGLETEQNDSALKQAITGLPSYIPGSKVWESIELDLDLVQESEASDKLQQHSPPDFIWDNIESQLPLEEKVIEPIKIKQPKTHTRRIYLSVAAAAAMALLVISTFLFLPTSSSDSIAYSEEWVDETGDDFWIDEDSDEALDVLTAICSDQPPVCKDPAFQNLQSELDFLNESLEEFKLNMSAFDDDETLIAALTELEIERNEVVKEMIDKIL